MDFASFMAMDGYALYVWGAYGLALAGYGGVLIHALIQLDRKRKETKK